MQASLPSPSLSGPENQMASKQCIALLGLRAGNRVLPLRFGVSTSPTPEGEGLANGGMLQHSASEDFACRRVLGLNAEWYSA